MATATPTRTRTTAPAGAETTRTEKGISLARGPALVLGTILLAAGLYFLYRAHTFPRFANFPNGSAPRDGNFFFGIFGANGWTGEFTAVAGGLLLLGAAEHVLAKTMSLIVGCALGAAAVIAVISGNVLGMAAANGWTELGWAVCAVILLFNTLVPRRRRTVVVQDPAAVPGRRAYREPVGPGPRTAGAGTAAAGTAGTAAAGTAAATPSREPAGREPATAEPATGDPATGEPAAPRGRAADGTPLVTREDGTPVEGPATEQTAPLRRE